VPVRDQRCVSLGIYEILEILTCGGFPIRSATESPSAVISDRDVQVMSVFLKICDIHSMATSSGSCEGFRDEAGADAFCTDLGNQGHQIVVKLWFTIVECFSRSICLSATTMRMTEGD
jgi:hypothetical protein